VVANAKVLAEGLLSKGFTLVTGGTDNHLILIDLRSKNVTGKVAAQALDRAGIVGNYNSIPFDPRKPFDPSGFRIGTPSITSRGMGKDEMLKLADFMAQVVAAPDDAQLTTRVAAQVKEMCLGFPPPGIPV
jgi:glycine hydroxymethyltransferase